MLSLMVNLNFSVMKKIAIIYIASIVFSFSGIAQTIENIDFISPFNDGVAAIQKGDKWAFINNQGDLVIDFRSDLVLTTIENIEYPVFNSDRCLIVEKKDGIAYFGFIDKSGKTVITPQFLNATNFNNDRALAIELVKTELGNNDLLEKPMVDYDYLEVIINPTGEITNYLTQEPKHVTLSKEYLRKPLEISAKLISDDAFAIWTKENKWEIKKIQR